MLSRIKCGAFLFRSKLSIKLGTALALNVSDIFSLFQAINFSTIDEQKIKVNGVNERLIVLWFL